MFVREEVIRKYSTLKVQEWEKAYSELKDILERGFKFDRVEERDFRHHKDRGRVESKILCHVGEDKYTEILVTMRVIIEISEDGSSAEIELRSKGEVLTEYPEETSFQNSLVYIALRSIWDKFFYGWARGKWKEECRELLNDIHSDIRRFYRTL